MATKAAATKVPAAKAPAKKVIPLGIQVDALYRLHEELRAHHEVEKDIKARIEAAEVELTTAMEREGVEKMTGKFATASRTTSIVGNVTDWDVFYAYIYKNKFGHLLQRRLSDPAIRELLDTKGSVPGVEPFKKQRMNIRKLS